jgi:hypothetical protein
MSALSNTSFDMAVTAAYAHNMLILLFLEDSHKEDTADQSRDPDQRASRS